MAGEGEKKIINISDFDKCYEEKGDRMLRIDMLYRIVREGSSLIEDFLQICE